MTVIGTRANVAPLVGGHHSPKILISKYLLANQYLLIYRHGQALTESKTPSPGPPGGGVFVLGRGSSSGQDAVGYIPENFSWTFAIGNNAVAVDGEFGDLRLVPLHSGYDSLLRGSRVEAG
jgi:hypothetical protein